MSPFAALGLDDDADTSAVKRAYAQKLRTTRPDEDAAGFQRLNSAYKAALAAIDRRAEAAAWEAAQPDETGSPVEGSGGAGYAEPAAREFEDPAFRIEPEADEPPASSREPAMSLPFDYAQEHDERLEFDFDAFSTDLLKIASAPGADLGLWLARTTAHWPLALKPTLAPHVLQWLSDESLLLPPGRFAAIVAAFGLDDVLTAVDPLALDQAGRRIEANWTEREAAARLEVLLRPGHREALVAFAKGHHSGLKVRTVAALIFGAKAERWTFLRWVPHGARHVMGVLRTISDGRVERLSPPADPEILERWSGAERRMRNVTIGNIFALTSAVYFLMTVVVPFVAMMAHQLVDDGSSRLDEIAAYEQSDSARAVAAYDEYLATYAAPGRTPTVGIARALYNKGVDQERVGDNAGAADTYRKLDEVFSTTTNQDCNFFRLMGLVRFGQLELDEYKYQPALTIARRIVHDGTGTNDVAIDWQVARALNLEANTFRKMNDEAAAIGAADSVIELYGKSTDSRLEYQVRDAMQTKDAIRASFKPAPETFPLKIPDRP